MLTAISLSSYELETTTVEYAESVRCLYPNPCFMACVTKALFWVNRLFCQGTLFNTISPVAKHSANFVTQHSQPKAAEPKPLFQSYSFARLSRQKIGVSTAYLLRFCEERHDFASRNLHPRTGKIKKNKIVPTALDTLRLAAQRHRTVLSGGLFGQKCQEHEVALKLSQPREGLGDSWRELGLCPRRVWGRTPGRASNG